MFIFIGKVFVRMYMVNLQKNAYLGVKMKSYGDFCEKFRSYSSSRMGRRDFAAVVWSLVRRVYCMYELTGVFIASANGALFLRHSCI